MKKLLALLLCVLFLFVMLAACGDKNGGENDRPPGTDGPGGDGEEEEGPPTFTPPDYDLPDKEADVIRYTADGRRHIIIGTFYDMYYDSTH